MNTKVERMTDCEYELVDETSDPCHNSATHIDRMHGVMLCMNHVQPYEVFVEHEMAKREQTAWTDVDFQPIVSQKSAPQEPAKVAEAETKSGENNGSADQGAGPQSVFGSEASELPHRTD